MSNHNAGEKPAPRKSKVSVALTISHGLGGPKVIAKAVTDGQLVNIPALPASPMRGRGKQDQTSYWFDVADL